MKKRDFIRVMSLGAVGITIGTPLLNACKSLHNNPGMPVWVWMSARGGSTGQWKKKFRELTRLGVSGILIQASEEQYPELASLAKKAGLEIHAWIVVLNHRNRETMDQHPEWFTVSREGKSTIEYPPYVGYYSWLCPSRIEVREFIAERVDRLAKIENLDGVHLDYIRHSDVILPVGLWSKYNLVQDKEYPEFDFCYCDVCREQFKQQQGIDPMEIEEPAEHKEWLQFRYDSVTRLVNELAEITRDHGKKLTAAVFPTPEIAKKLVRQEWLAWNLDAVYPMIYHNFYEEDISWIETATREGTGALNGRFPLYSGLYIPALTPENIGQAVQYAMTGGAAGVTFFNERAMSRKFWKNIV